jgi:hypothetical protein
VKKNMLCYWPEQKPYAAVGGVWLWFMSVNVAHGLLYLACNVLVKGCCIKQKVLHHDSIATVVDGVPVCMGARCSEAPD